MESFCEYARAIVPLIRRCFCGDEDFRDDELENGNTRLQTVVRESSPITRDIRSGGLGHFSTSILEIPSDPEDRGDGVGDRPGHVNERGPVLIDNFVEERSTGVEHDDVHSILMQQSSTANEVDEDSPAIIELIATEGGSSSSEESVTTPQQREGELSVGIGEPEEETASRSVNNFFKVTTWFCVAPHDITTASKIGSKWGIVQKATFVALVGLALLRPMSYLKSNYMNTESKKTDVVRYASFAIQLVTVSAYLVTHTFSLAEVRNFLDSLTGKIPSMNVFLPVLAMFLSLVGTFFEGALSSLSEWSLEGESDYQTRHMKHLFLQWGTGNDTQDIDDQWTELDTTFAVTGFLSQYTAYFMDYFVQDMFLIIAILFSAYSNKFTNNMQKILESNDGNRYNALKNLVREYEELQEKKEGFNNAFGGLFDCFHFRNLFRSVYFVYSLVEKIGFWDLAFFSVSTTKAWIVYYLASKAMQLNGRFRHLISTNLEAFTQAVGETKVNFLLNDILVNPVGLGDGVSFVDGRFISEMISMIATYVVILVTNKD